LEAVRARLQNKYERDLRLLRDAKRLVLAPHPDADGFTAAALLVSGFKLLDRRWTLMPINTPSRSFTREDLSDLFKIKPDFISYLDITPNNAKQLQLLKKQTSLVLIDHHHALPSILDYFLLAINPEPTIHASAGAYPTGKLMYDLIGASAREDLALVSIMGDRTDEAWRSFVKGFSEEMIETAGKVAKRLSAVGGATRVDKREPRKQILRRQRTLFNYLVRSKSLAAFLTSFDATRTLIEPYQELGSGIDAAASKAQIAIESGVEFIHIPLKNKSPWSVISGTLGRMELVATAQTVVISEPWPQGQELRVITNDPDIDVPTLLGGFGGGHHNIGGGHSQARLNEIIELIRKRWSKLKQEA